MPTSTPTAAVPPPNFTPVPGIQYNSCRFPNPKGVTAVCCLWEPVERAVERYPDAFMVGPCVSPAGVDMVLRTLLANPRITQLVIEGPDLTGTREILSSLLDTPTKANAFLHGIAESVIRNVQYMGLFKFTHENLPQEILPGGLHYGLHRTKRRTVLPLPAPDPGPSPTGPGAPGIRVTGASLWDVWPRVIREVMNHGAISKTSYGDEQKELLALNWTFGVAETLKGAPEWAPDTAEDLDSYAAAHFTGEAPKPEGVEYVYRDRLVSKWDDQLARVVALLQENPGQRRGWLSTWDCGGPGWGSGQPASPAKRGADAPPLVAYVRDPTGDGPLLVWAEPGMVDVGDGWVWRDAEYMAHYDVAEAEEGTWVDLGDRPSDISTKSPPCLTGLWFRQDKNGALFTYAVFRSHDLFKAGVGNAWGLCRLAEQVAGQLDWPVGQILIQSLSAHIYDRDWADARELAHRRGRKTFEDDAERAILRVRGIAGAIPPRVAVDLLSPAGTQLDTIGGTSVEAVEAEVLRRGWISTLSHAAWLGRELARAGL